MACFVSQLRDFDPINLILAEALDSFLPRKPRKLIASVLWVPLIIFGSLTTLPTILIILAGSVAGTNFARCNLQMSKDLNGMRATEKIAVKWSKLELLWIQTLKKIFSRPRKRNKIVPNPVIANTKIEQNPDNFRMGIVGGAAKEEADTNQLDINSVFRQRFLSHSQITLLIRDCNARLWLYCPLLQGVGLIICVMANCGFIKLGNKAELILVAFCAFVSVVFTLMNLLLINYGSQIGTLTEATIQFWKGVRVGKMERRQVRAMQVVYMTMGSWFPIRKATALDVMDVIMNQTVAFITV